ncbi:MAG: tetratricopeptide repeat protein [Planctomycetes bacterium]|nr:tetratricopeptide repeat protein [Planctomycetota bacterium]
MDEKNSTDSSVLRMALRTGRVSAAQVDQCIADREAGARREGRPPSTLATLLVAKGFLSEAALGELLAAVRDAIDDPAAAQDPSGLGDELFGRRLVAHGLASPEQVDDALGAQARLRPHGVAIRLGELLVGRGVLTSEQVKDALALQDKTILVCPRCSRSFNVRGHAPGREVPCPTCGGPLAAPAPGGTIRVSGSSPDLQPLGPQLRAPGAPGAADATGGGVKPSPRQVPKSPSDVAPTLVVGEAPVPPTPPRTEPATRIGGPAPGEGGAPPSPSSPAGPAVPATLRRSAAPGPSREDASSPESDPTVVRAEDSPALRPGGQPAAAAGIPFGRYRLLKELGRGGMGVVHMAWDGELKRVVALKTLLASWGGTGEDVARFQREARAAARLRHPNVVQVHDVGAWEGRHYFTMDFIQGESLAVAMDKLPPRRFLEILRDVALALHAAHEAGVVHRDVKPANILLDGAGRPYVTDFGLAKEVRQEGASRLTVSGAIMGTPQYMAPEQADGRSADIGPRTDVWSLGVLLYAQLAGRMPFDGDTLMAILHAIASKDPELPSRVHAPGERRRAVHRDLETVCLKCLERDPARRYASAEALAADLGRFLDGEPILARPVSLTERVVRRALKHRKVLLPIAAALLAAAGFGVYAWRAGGERARAVEEAASSKRSEATTSAEAEADRFLLQAEGLWREAKVLLYRTDVPIERYHEKLRSAMDVYERASARAPRYGWIYESRGRLRIQAKELNGAQEDLERAAALLGAERGKAARRSLGRVYLEQSFELTFDSKEEADRVARKEEADRWRARALVELEASSGEIEWRGTAEEGENARRLADGFAALSRGDAARAEAVFREGLEKSNDEECAWALSLVPGPRDATDWPSRALGMRPRYARAYLARARVHLRKSEHDAAIADAEEVLKLTPRDGHAFLVRGVARHYKADVEGAVADYGRALELEPRLAFAYTSRAAARSGKRDFDGAIADLTEALKLLPAFGMAYVRRGDARRQKGEREAAFSDYAEGIRLSPHDGTAFLYRGIARAAEGDAGGAIADYTEAIRLSPLDRTGYYYRGTARYKQGELEGAIADYTEVLKLDPDYADAYQGRSVARYLKGEYDASMADARELLRLNPRSVMAHLGLAHDLWAKRDVDGAIVECTEALRLNPREARALYSRGVARKAKGDLVGAIADQGEALRIDPKYSAAFVARAEARAAKGELEGAIADFGEAIRLDPREPGAYVGRARARADRKDLDGGISDCTEALRLNPRLAEAYFNRGKWRGVRREFEGAFADLDEAIRLAPANAEFYGVRGFLRKARGDVGGAASDFKEVLRLTPADSSDRGELEELLRSFSGAGSKR